MKTLRKPGKVDKLFSLFDEIGKKFTVEEVCSYTGIPNYNALKAFCSYIRNAKHIPEENRIDIRIRDGFCVRKEHVKRI